jgi:hypothetical protein
LKYKTKSIKILQIWWKKGNNSKMGTVNNIKNLTWGKNDQHIKIYLPCNFKVIWLPILELLPFFHQICKILLVHGITGHNFETRHPSNDSDQVWFPLVWYFQRRRFLKKFTTYDGRRRRTPSDENSNFEVNLITHLGVIALFSSNL